MGKWRGSRIERKGKEKEEIEIGEKERKGGKV